MEKKLKTIVFCMILLDLACRSKLSVASHVKYPIVLNHNDSVVWPSANQTSQNFVVCFYVLSLSNWNFLRLIVNYFIYSYDWEIVVKILAEVYKSCLIPCTAIKRVYVYMSTLNSTIVSLRKRRIVHFKS